MKKVVSILLSLAMLFAFAALAGCAKEAAPAPEATKAPAPEATKAPTAAPTKNADPYAGMDYREKAKAKLANGEEVVIGVSFLALDSYIAEVFDDLKARYEKIGVTFYYVGADMSVNTQIAQLENFIEMGIDLCIVGVVDKTAEIDAINQVHAAGIGTMTFGVTDAKFWLDGLINVNQTTLGQQMGGMVVAWLDKQYPDAGQKEIKGCLMTVRTNDGYPDREAGAMEAINADGRLEFVFENANCLQIDEGYTTAEQAMTYDKNIRCFLSLFETCAYGANNYLISLNQSEYDLTEFAVFLCASSQEAYTLIDQSKTNDGSVLRGIVNYGGGEFADILYDVSYGILLGELELPFTRWDPLFTYNTFGFELPKDINASADAASAH